MKKYNVEWLENRIKNEEAISRAKKERPFPGKAPTRIYLSSKCGQKRFKYIGKPSIHALRAFSSFNSSLNNKQEHTITVSAEFDKKNIINLSKMSGKLCIYRKTNEILWTFYHPHILSSVFPDWLKYRIKTDNRLYRIS